MNRQWSTVLRWIRRRRQAVWKLSLCDSTERRLPDANLPGFGVNHFCPKAALSQTVARTKMPVMRATQIGTR